MPHCARTTHNSYILCGLTNKKRISLFGVPKAIHTICVSYECDWQREHRMYIWNDISENGIEMNVLGVCVIAKRAVDGIFRAWLIELLVNTCHRILHLPCNPWIFSSKIMADNHDA